jgi:hypothetical protein
MTSARFWLIGLSLSLLTVGACAAPPAGEVVRTSIGIYDPNGRLVRQWALADADPEPVADWDGLDDAGRPLPPGEYSWKSVRLPVGAMRSRWVSAIGADPAIDSAGNPIYFPGSIIGATQLETDGQGLYFGTAIADASDVIRKTDLNARRAYWKVGLLEQTALHQATAMAFGGPGRGGLYVLQTKGTVHPYTRDGRAMPVKQVPKLSEKGGSSHAAANKQYLAVSYPHENRIRLFTLPQVEPAGEIEADAPESLCFLGDTGRELAFVSVANAAVFRADTDGQVTELTDEISHPALVARMGAGLVVATNETTYLHRAYPEANAINAERGIARRGSQVVVLDRTGKVLRTLGTGETNYHGPWKAENLNGAGDLVVRGQRIFLLDWPHRLVILSADDGKLLREVFLGEGSYFTLPIAEPGRSDRLWVRGMYAKFLWTFQVDPLEGTWRAMRLISNSAVSMGASQNQFYRLGRIAGRRVMVTDGPVSVLAITGNRTRAMLRLHTKAPDGADPNQRYFFLRENLGDPNGQVLPRPTIEAVGNAPQLLGLSNDGTTLVTGNGYAPVLARMPAKVIGEGAVRPLWDKARKLYDASRTHPGLDAYQHFPGVFDEDGTYYGTFADRNINVQRGKEQHLYWPGVESAHTRLYGVGPDGQVRFEVGRIGAVRDDPGGFVQANISGRVNELLLVTDRATPGQRVYTTDGLYVGNTWEHLRDDEVPATLQDPYRRADIVRGAILQTPDGRVFHAQPNINRVDLYEIIGLDAVRHDRGSLTLTEARRSAPADAEGTGLRATYYRDADATDAIETRVDERLRFHSDPYLYDHTWKRWPEGTAAVEWTGELEVPLTDDYLFDVRVGSPGDRVTVEIDGRVILRSRKGMNPVYVQADRVRLQAGRRLPITVRYVPAGGPKVLSLNWRRPATNRRFVPTRYLYPPANTDAP